MDNQILQKLTTIQQQINQLQEQGKHTFQFFNKALSNYEITTNKQSDHPLKTKILEQLRTDQDIRYPHQKIIHYLLDQYDYQTKHFKKIYFSKIVKETRIGKNKAKEYFSLLIEKGLIERSTDGYKVFYQIKKTA